MVQAIDLSDILAKLPEVDDARKVNGPRWVDAQQLAQQTLVGGGEALQTLLEQSAGEYGDADYKPRYLVHMIVLYVCQDGMEDNRQLVVNSLAKVLSGDQPEGLKAFAIGELQVIGSEDAAKPLGDVLSSGNDRLSEAAARALQAIGAVEPLLANAPTAQGRTKQYVLHALGSFKDAKSAPLFLQALTDNDLNVRIIAGQTLGRMGDVESVAALTKASDAPGWEGVQQTKALLLLAEQLSAAGKLTEARQIYTHLRDQRTGDNNQYIRDLSERALSALG